MNTAFREKLKDKQRIVIKIGSSSLTHPDTGYLDLIKLEVLVREISDLRNQGKDVILVSSGAIMWEVKPWVTTENRRKWHRNRLVRPSDRQNS